MSKLCTVTLVSTQSFGGRIPPKAVGELLRVFPDAVRSSIRMAFESRSRAKGKPPRWLTAASDIRFLHDPSHYYPKCHWQCDPEKTILYFEAPRLEEAAEKIYEQQELWPTRPDGKDTGFDLLADVINDVRDHNFDSDRFDRPLLRQIENFKQGLNDTFQQIEFTGSRFSSTVPAVINMNVVESSKQLSYYTPQPQQVRIFGTLDMIRSSTNSFAIKLKDGQELRGALTEGKATHLTNLLEQEVLILGKAIYRPSGKLLRIDADEVIRAEKRDSFFSSIPNPKRSRFDLRETFRGQEHKKGMAAIYGKWPGDESDEEISAALKELH